MTPDDPASEIPIERTQATTDEAFVQFLTEWYCDDRRTTSVRFGVGVAFHRLRWPLARTLAAYRVAAVRLCQSGKCPEWNNGPNPEPIVALARKTYIEGEERGFITYKSNREPAALEAVDELLADHKELAVAKSGTRRGAPKPSIPTEGSNTSDAEDAEPVAVTVVLLGETEKKRRREELRERGRALHGEVITAIRTHYYFDEPWHATLVATFVLQSWIAALLPAVFYIFFGGTLGSGKTNILVVVGKLTKALTFENTSNAALARSIGSARKGVAVMLDEIDVEREEYSDVRDALLRQGYKADAAPYTRVNVETGGVERIPIFGPKAATLRGVLDDALASRGFLIPTAAPIGEEHYELVLANLFGKLGDLPDRLQEWGEGVAEVYDRDSLEAVARSPEFRGRMARLVPALGANRESELLTVITLVVEVCGLEVEDDLRHAAELRRLEVDAADNGARDDVVEAVGELVRATPIQEVGETGSYRMLQKDVHTRVNERRRKRGNRPLGDRTFAKLRRDLGLRDGWLDAPGNRLRRNLPQEFVDGLAAQVIASRSKTPPHEIDEGSLDPALANRANQTNHSTVDGELAKLAKVAGGDPTPLDPTLRAKSRSLP